MVEYKEEEIIERNIEFEIDNMNSYNSYTIKVVHGFLNCS